MKKAPDIKDWIDTQRQRSALAAEVTLPAEVFLQILDLLDEALVMADKLNKLRET